MTQEKCSNKKMISDMNEIVKSLYDITIVCETEESSNGTSATIEQVTKKLHAIDKQLKSSMSHTVQLEELKTIANSTIADQEKQIENLESQVTLLQGRLEENDKRKGIMLPDTSYEAQIRSMKRTINQLQAKIKGYEEEKRNVIAQQIDSLAVQNATKYKEIDSLESKLQALRLAQDEQLRHLGKANNMMHQELNKITETESRLEALKLIQEEQLRQLEHQQKISKAEQSDDEESDESSDLSSRSSSSSEGSDSDESETAEPSLVEVGPENLDALISRVILTAGASDESSADNDSQLKSVDLTVESKQVIEPKQLDVLISKAILAGAGDNSYTTEETTSHPSTTERTRSNPASPTTSPVISSWNALTQSSETLEQVDNSAKQAFEQLKQTRDKYSKLKEEYAMANGAASNLWKTFEDDYRTSKIRVEQLEAENAKLKEENDLTLSKIKALSGESEKKHQENRQDLNQIVGQVEELREENRRLKQTQEETMSELKDNLEEIAAHAERLKNENERMKMEKGAASSNMTAETLKLTEALEELAERAARIEELEKENLELRQEQERSLSKMNELLTAVAEAGKLQQDLQDLRETSSLLEKENNRLKHFQEDVKIAAETKITQLEEELEKSRKKYKAVQKEKSERLSNLKDVIAAYKKLEMEHQELQNSVLSMTGQVHQAKNESLVVTGQ